MEDIDCYIDCLNGNKVFHYGGNVLQAYIPSIGRGRNTIKAIGDDLIFDVEETSSEVLFKFKYSNSDKVIPLLKPKTGGANISPFSSRNLPKTDYKIPDDEILKYKAIVSQIGKKQIHIIARITNEYIKHIGKDTKDNIKRLCVKPIIYFYMIGKYDDYLKYLKKGIEKYRL